MVDQVSGQCNVCERMQGTLYKRLGHIAKSSSEVTQQRKLGLGEIALIWKLYFLFASALNQDLGVTDLDVEFCQIQILHIEVLTCTLECDLIWK